MYETGPEPIKSKQIQLNQYFFFFQNADETHAAAFHTSDVRQNVESLQDVPDLSGFTCTNVTLFCSVILGTPAMPRPLIPEESTPVATCHVRNECFHCSFTKQAFPHTSNAILFFFRPLRLPAWFVLHKPSWGESGKALVVSSVVSTTTSCSSKLTSGRALLWACPPLSGQ